jgi:hypothetical protein
MPSKYVAVRQGSKTYITPLSFAFAIQHQNPYIAHLSPTMADPLSISASVAGLLSLTIELTKSLNNYISGVKSAPEDSKRLCTETEALSAVLEKLVKFLRDQDKEGDETS